MTEYKTFQAELRTASKKASAKRLRRSGRIPAIIYGRGQPTPISLDAHEFLRAFPTISESMIMTIQAGGQSFDVLMKDYDEDLLSNSVLHVDFYQIEHGKLLRANAPIHLVGSAIGSREGGVLEAPLHYLEIECLPKDIPQQIAVDITNLEVGHSLHLRDIEPLPGVRFLNNPDQVVVLVAASREAISEGVEEEEAGIEEGLSTEERQE